MKLYYWCLVLTFKLGRQLFGVNPMIGLIADARGDAALFRAKLV